MAANKQTEERRERLAKFVEWIELANFFPPYDPLPEEPSKRLLDGVWKQWRSWAKRKHRLFWADEIEKNIHTRLAGNLSKSAGCEVYQLIRSVRETLDAIASQFELAQARLAKKPSATTELGDDEDPFPDEWQPIRLPPLIALGELNDEGGIDYDCGHFEEFLKLLKGIKACKIRRCRKCEQLFYASRTDRWTCSVQCQAAYRMQQWRLHSPKYETARQTSKKAEQLGMMKATELSRLSAGLREDAASTRSTAREPYLSK